MAKRLPRPAAPVRARCELDEAELRAVEDAAHLCRLSVASFIRVALVESAASEGRVDAWKAIAERLALGTGDGPPKRPGRPRSAPAAEAAPDKPATKKRPKGKK